MNSSGSLEAIAEELRNLRCRQKELGAAALQVIRQADAELAGLLLEAFGPDGDQAGMWLAQPNMFMDTTPIEMLAAGRRDVVSRVLAGIMHGFGA
jgi:hypothetical protein